MTPRLSPELEPPAVTFTPDAASLPLYLVTLLSSNQRRALADADAGGRAEGDRERLARWIERADDRPFAGLVLDSGLGQEPRRLADYAEHALLPAVEARFFAALTAQDLPAAAALLYGLEQRLTPAPRGLLGRCRRQLLAALLCSARIKGARSEDYSRSPDR